MVPGRLLRKKDVLALVGVKTYSTIWRWIKDGGFPRPIQLNPNCRNPPIAWREQDINAWIASRPVGPGAVSPMTRHLAARAAAEADAAARRHVMQTGRVKLLPPHERGRRAEAAQPTN